MRGGWSRRSVLAAAGGAGITGILAGCSWFEPEPPPSPPPPDPLEPLLASTRALAARYDAALAAFPELSERLRPLYEAHTAHETALLEVIGRPELATPSLSGSPARGAWAPPVGDPTASPSATTPEEALAGLREAEREGQREAAQACLSAPAERAALLGSISAARATHAEVLG